MKKIIALLAVLVLLFAFFGGCAVNSTTGGITVKNNATKDASNVKVGTVNIGYIGAGQTTTVYFYSNEDSAVVSASGFDLPAGNSGKINLKINYSYLLLLYQNSTGNYISMSGSKLGDGNTSENMN